VALIPSLLAYRLKSIAEELPQAEEGIPHDYRHTCENDPGERDNNLKDVLQTSGRTLTHPAVDRTEQNPHTSRTQNKY
jgi:hypothetical protein